MGAILGGAAIIGGTSLLGGLLSKGSKPKVPAFKPIDFAAEQKQAIQQNIGSLESATDLATKTTAAEQSQLEQQLRRRRPGPGISPDSRSGDSRDRRIQPLCHLSACRVA